MKFDNKIFWKYIWYEHLNVKKMFKSSIFYEYILLFLLFYSVFFTSLDLGNKVILTVAFLFSYSFLKFWALYKSGYHRAWNRKKYGILTKSQLRKTREDEIKEERRADVIATLEPDFYPPKNNL